MRGRMRRFLLPLIELCSNCRTEEDWLSLETTDIAADDDFCFDQIG